MLLILQIILTIAAWKKGWRGYALIPASSAILVGFIIGAIAGAMGYTETQVRQLAVIFLPLDLICIGVLIWMTAKGRKLVQTVVAEEKLELNGSAVTRTV